MSVDDILALCAGPARLPWFEGTLAAPTRRATAEVAEAFKVKATRECRWGENHAQPFFDLRAAERVHSARREGDGRGNIYRVHPSRGPDRLVILNMGLGKDSMTMLALLSEGRLEAEGHILRPQDLDAILFADTGREWQHTYDAVADVERILADIKRRTGVQIPFYWIRKPPEAAWRAYLSDLAAGATTNPTTGRRAFGGKLHREARWQAWQQELADASIAEKAAGGYYHTAPPITEAYSLARPKPYIVQHSVTSCTDNHKVQPMRRLMADLGRERWGEGYTHGKWAQLVKAGKRVPHLNLLGIALGEGAATGGREVYLHCYDPKRAAHRSELVRRVAAIKRTNRRLPPSKQRSFKKLLAKSRTATRGSEAPFVEAYPLSDMQITKEGEEPILKRHGLSHIRKSGCVMCHSQPPDWYWALWFYAKKLRNKWALDHWKAVTDYERLSLESGGQPVLNRSTTVQRRAMEKKWGTPGKVAARVGNRKVMKTVYPQGWEGGERPLDEVVRIIARDIVEPRVRQLRQAQPMSKREAELQVAKAILAKDYAQGCKIGSENRGTGHQAEHLREFPLGFCPEHGGWHECV